jgi:hypothetical protein
MNKRVQGQNVKKLIVRFMSRQAIPHGGGMADGISFLTDKKAIIEAARNATVLAFEAIDLVRAAPDCEWTTDEEIAAQIVASIEERRR